MPTSPKPPQPLLTPRQLEVLELLAKGLTNREIAGVLGISAGTVKVHVSAVIEALEVTNRTEAALALRELGLGGPEDGEEEKPDARVDEAVPGFGQRPAIAVLPFDPIGAEVDAGFVDGLVEDLITRLAAWRWFPVIARNSTFTYQGRAVDVVQVARELGARYVVEGSVRRSGDRIRVTVQLIEGRAGHHVFAERFDRRIEDVFDAQDAIVETVMGALAPALVDVEGLRALRTPVAGLGAWEAFHRGAALVRLQAPEAMREAVELLERAVAEEPGFAAAHASLAFAHVGRATWAVGQTQLAPTDAEGLQSALVEAAQQLAAAAAASERAVAADAHDPLANLAAGTIAILQRRMADAEVALARALELDPSSAPGAWLLGHVLCSREGGPAEAIPLFRRALRLSPRDPFLHHFLGGLAMAHLLAGEPAEGLEAARRSVSQQPAVGISYAPVVVAGLVRLGRMEEARAEAQRLRAQQPGFNLGLVRQLGSEAQIALIRDTLAAAGWDVPG